MSILKLIALLGFVFPLFCFGNSRVCEGSRIFGKWQWYKYIYEGAEYPPSNPNLNLVFEFFPNGRDRLFWERSGQPGFCERYGNYIFKSCRLLDQVTWVNPQNAMGCGSDPDMRVGRVTVSQLEIIDDELYLHLDLSGRPFIYVWRRQ